MGKLVRRAVAEHVRLHRDRSRIGRAGERAVQALFCSSVCCNSASADRIVVAASRLLGAAAACVILLLLQLDLKKSYWSDRIKVAIMICQQISSILALVIFL